MELQREQGSAAIKTQAELDRVRQLEQDKIQRMAEYLQLSKRAQNPEDAKSMAANAIMAHPMAEGIVADTTGKQARNVGLQLDAAMPGQSDIGALKTKNDLDLLRRQDMRNQGAPIDNEAGISADEQAIRAASTAAAAQDAKTAEEQARYKRGFLNAPTGDGGPTISERTAYGQAMIPMRKQQVDLSGFTTQEALDKAKQTEAANADAQGMQEQLMGLPADRANFAKAQLEQSTRMLPYQHIPHGSALFRLGPDGAVIPDIVPTAPNPMSPKNPTPQFEFNPTRKLSDLNELNPELLKRLGEEFKNTKGR